MNAQGVELNEPECLPIDPFTSNALIKKIQKVNRTPTDDDKLRRCLEFQGMVLTYANINIFVTTLRYIC